MNRGRPAPAWSPLLVVLVLGGLVLALPAPAADGGGRPDTAMDHSGRSVIDKQAALKASRAVVGDKLALGDYTLRDRDGNRISLSRFEGKPLVISLIYTSCYHICPMTTKNLAEAVDQARGHLGEDAFRVVTIGFDTANDTPGAMTSFARKQGVAGRPDWWFLSGDTATVEALTAALGFRFKPSPNGFDHVVQTTVVDPGGEIYRHIYGKAFAPPRLVRPLKELVLGSARGSLSLSGITDNIRFFCTTYDPSSGAYRFDYGFFLRVFLVFGVLLAVATFLFREIRKSRTASSL